MSGNDYVKYVTQQVVNYMDQPKEERVTKKQERKSNRQPRLMRWFGLIPMAVSMIVKKSR